MEKNEVRLLLYIMYKVYSECIKDLNLRTKTIQLLEENIGKHLHYLGFHNSFLHKTPKSQARKEKKKIDKSNFIKIKTIAHQKTLSTGNPQNGRKYLQITYLIRV